MGKRGGGCQTAAMTRRDKPTAELMRSRKQPHGIIADGGADVGLDTSSRRQKAEGRDGQSPKDIPLPPQISSRLTRRLAGDQMFATLLPTFGKKKNTKKSGWKTCPQS